MADINDGKGSLVWWDNEWCYKCELYRDSFYIAAVHKQNLRNLIISELQHKSKQTFGMQVTTAGKVAKKDTFHRVLTRKSYKLPKVTRGTNKLGFSTTKNVVTRIGRGGRAHPSHAQWLQIKFSQVLNILLLTFFSILHQNDSSRCCQTISESSYILVANSPVFGAIDVKGERSET